MTRILGALGALLSLLLAAPPAVASPDAEGEAEVVYYDLYDATVQPPLIHSAFNASPRMRVRTWRHWGAATAVGRGTWVSTCASCPPPRARRAVVTLSRIQSCDDGVRHYSRIVVKVGRPDRGGTRTTYRLTTGCPPPPVA